MEAKENDENGNRRTAPETSRLAVANLRFQMLLAFLADWGTGCMGRKNDGRRQAAGTRQRAIRTTQAARARESKTLLSSSVAAQKAPSIAERPEDQLPLSHISEGELKDAKSPEGIQRRLKLTEATFKLEHMMLEEKAYRAQGELNDLQNQKKRHAGKRTTRSLDLQIRGAEERKDAYERAMEKIEESSKRLGQMKDAIVINEALKAAKEQKNAKAIESCDADRIVEEQEAIEDIFKQAEELYEEIGSIVTGAVDLGPDIPTGIVMEDDDDDLLEEELNSLIGNARSILRSANHATTTTAEEEEEEGDARLFRVIEELDQIDIGSSNSSNNNNNFRGAPPPVVISSASRPSVVLEES